MKKLLEKLGILLQKFLPSPFSLAVILTFITFLSALFFIPGNIAFSGKKILLTASYFNKGFWDLLVFSMQMILILVLGHVLALTPTIKQLIKILVKNISNNASAALIVSLFTVMLSLVNWGLGLIFGAIFSRQLAENFAKNNRPINFPLIAAAGYSGLMVWHGGLSGSAPLKIAESEHFLVDKIGVVPVSETIFSSMNISVAVALIIMVPLFFYFIGKIKYQPVRLLPISEHNEKELTTYDGMERIDHSRIFSLLFALFIFSGIVFRIFYSEEEFSVNLNVINLFLFALSILLHKNFHAFLNAVSISIKGAAGILVQFPIYAGIMGLMKYSGLLESITNALIYFSTPETFRYFTFIIAGIVNFFVPSGGGQWAVQGSVIVEAAQQLHIPISKAVMALVYGDQLTNMIQPFWALPLLGITRLKAKQIFPYTFLLMILGLLIFSLGIVLF